MQKALWVFLISGTLIMIYIMKRTGNTLETTATPLGIVNLEVAANKSSVLNILQAWKKTDSNPDNIAAAKKNTLIDFLFIIFYAPFLFFSCRSLSAGFKTKSFFSKTGNLAAMGIIPAAILDVLENFGMLQSLNGDVTDNIALFTASCSVVKWGLVFFAIIYLLAALSAKIFTRLFNN